MISNYIKNRIDINKIIDKIEQYEYISFDLFDTLIKRNIDKPTDIFHLVKQIAKEKYNIDLKNFVDLRIEAEKNCYSNLSKKEETNLEDIYKQIVYDEKIRNILIKIEEYVEINISNINYDIFRIYKYCINRNKKIYLISDMYLNKAVIEKILDKNKIFIYDKLYISSDVGFRKYTGNLYKYIIEKENINRYKWLHIGDGKIADFFRAKQNKIEAILIPRKIKNTKYDIYNKNILESKKIKFNILNSFINNNLSKIEDRYKKIGYEIYGPLLYGFTKWLINNLKKEKIDKVLFFSRDGYIMQKSFDILNIDNIESYYLYASRKSLLLSIYYYYTLEEFWNKYSYTFPAEFSLEFFFERCDLNIKKYESIIKVYGFNKDSILKRKSLLYNKNFLSLYKEIEIDIKKNSFISNKALLKYLEQYLDKKKNNNIAVVDVGWRGTLQKLIEDVLEKENIKIKIKGFYVGVRENKNKIQMQGYLLNTPREISYMIFGFVSILELLFTAPHGSVRKYDIDKNGNLKILFEDYEYKNKREKEILTDLQIGALDFVKNINSNSFLVKLNFIETDIMFNNLFLLGTKPTLNEAKIIGDFICYDTLITKMAAPQSFFKYMISLKELKRDFIVSRWRIGFLKRLLKINIRYYKFIKFLYDLFSKKMG